MKKTSTYFEYKEGEVTLSFTLSTKEEKAAFLKLLELATKDVEESLQ